MIRKHIPNFVTILNLLSGSIAIVFTFHENLILASWFIGFAAVFDFLDGMLARLLNAKSPIGMELDSLADIISFGMAPAFIMYQMMQESFHIPFLFFNGVNILGFTAFLITAFSALRLAKFNIDEKQSTSFIGLPTPANALFFASLPIVLDQAKLLKFGFAINALTNYWLLLVLTIIFSSLLISPIPMFSLKFKNLRFRDNTVRYIFLFVSVMMFGLFGLFALPLIIVVYILISLCILYNLCK